MTPETRETAIKWLQNEIRSLRLAPTINGCGPENWADLLEIMEICLEAVRGHGSEPLTLEQLREMDGHPVWVERNETPHDGKWFIVDHADVENPDKTLYTKEGVTYSDYGVYFTAYAYPPAHIDREAWKECPWCKSEYTVIDDDFGQPVHPKMIKFCWKCGRPLTPEAWAMLEKRLRG